MKSYAIFFLLALLHVCHSYHVTSDVPIFKHRYAIVNMDIPIHTAPFEVYLSHNNNTVRSLVEHISNSTASNLGVIQTVSSPNRNFLPAQTNTKDAFTLQALFHSAGTFNSVTITYMKNDRKTSETFPLDDEVIVYDPRILVSVPASILPPKVPTKITITPPQILTNQTILNTPYQALYIDRTYNVPWALADNNARNATDHVVGRCTVSAERDAILINLNQTTPTFSCNVTIQAETYDPFHLTYSVPSLGFTSRSGLLAPKRFNPVPTPYAGLQRVNVFENNVNEMGKFEMEFFAPNAITVRASVDIKNSIIGQINHCYYTDDLRRTGTTEITHTGQHGNFTDLVFPPGHGSVSCLYTPAYTAASRSTLHQFRTFVVEPHSVENVRNITIYRPNPTLQESVSASFTTNVFNKDLITSIFNEIVCPGNICTANVHRNNNQRVIIDINRFYPLDLVYVKFNDRIVKKLAEGGMTIGDFRWIQNYRTNLQSENTFNTYTEDINDLLNSFINPIPKQISKQANIAKHSEFDGIFNDILPYY